MKVLTVCEQGLNRSVTAKWLVQHHGHECLAIGTNASSETFERLSDWAERIILLDRALHLPSDIELAKLVTWDVGADRYEHHYNPELVAKLRAYDAVTPWP